MRCTICDHPSQRDIDNVLRSTRRSGASVATAFGASKQAVYRHIESGHVVRPGQVRVSDRSRQALLIAEAEQAEKARELERLLRRTVPKPYDAPPEGHQWVWRKVFAQTDVGAEWWRQAWGHVRSRVATVLHVPLERVVECAHDADDEGYADTSAFPHFDRPGECPVCDMFAEEALTDVFWVEYADAHPQPADAGEWWEEWYAVPDAEAEAEQRSRDNDARRMVGVQLLPAIPFPEGGEEAPAA